MANKHGGGIALYVIIALVLGAITYLEFALVEYTIPWLTSVAILVLLGALSLAKFALVVAIYMHLRDDPRTYTGFFGSGMAMALATFIALSFLFSVRSVAVERAEAQEIRQQSEAAHGAEVLTVAERPFSEQLRAPQPKLQGITVPLPTAPQPEFRLSAAPATTPASPDESAAAEGASEVQAQAAGSFSWQDLGDETYSANCAACHQASGEGIAGAFPPLADHMPALYNAQGGRVYLIHVLLYGLQGEIDVNGQSYNGVMPAWAQLSDEQIAAVLNHELVSWDNEAALESFEPIQPQDVAAEREKGLSAADVLEARPALP